MSTVSRLKSKYLVVVLAMSLQLPVIAFGSDLYGTQPWRSGFTEALTEAQEAALPIDEARARWEQMTDTERATMMGGHRRAFVRGGHYRPDSETAAQARRTKEKAKAAASKKPAKKKK